jgi:hypothetical protein
LDFKLKLESQAGGSVPMPAVSAEVLTPTGAYPLTFAHTGPGEATLAAFGGTVESCAEFLSATPHRIHYREAESIACALEAPTVRIPLLIHLSLRTPSLLEDAQFRNVFDAALFQPGPWLELAGIRGGTIPPPRTAPCTRAELGTPLGILAMELANPPLVDLRAFRGTKQDHGVCWRNFQRRLRKADAEANDDRDKQQRLAEIRRQEQLVGVLPEGYSGDDGPFEPPPGWFPDQDPDGGGVEDQVEDNYGLEPEVRFKGGLCGDVEDQPLDVLMMLIRMVSRIESMVNESAFDEFQLRAAARSTGVLGAPAAHAGPGELHQVW